MGKTRSRSQWISGTESPLTVPIHPQNVAVAVNDSLATFVEKYSDPAREGDVGFIEGIIEEVIALEAITIARGLVQLPRLPSEHSSWLRAFLSGR